MRNRLRGVVTVVLVTGVAVACAGTTPDEQREAVVYEQVVRWLLDDGEGIGPTTPVFIDSLGADGIALEVQVEMIELLDDFETVRFIDEHVEAIDIDDPGRAVHDDGVLIALGDVPPEGPTVVRAELYRSKDERSARRFELAEEGSGWEIVQDPESIPVEALTGDLDGD